MRLARADIDVLERQWGVSMDVSIGRLSESLVNFYFWHALFGGVSSSLNLCECTGG
ncbi:hypothetical protein [Polaromonas sp. UBA4122]|uniref:hypothetical protein n=1 Tax=Polaromonas sp. UBA4122 TaxID=1947074 RepID=UPI0025F679C2|nr:hypothetical protein [Polaromonas sp. UBA4122]